MLVEGAGEHFPVFFWGFPGVITPLSIALAVSVSVTPRALISLLTLPGALGRVVLLVIVAIVAVGPLARGFAGCAVAVAMLPWRKSYVKPFHDQDHDIIDNLLLAFIK